MASVLLARLGQLPHLEALSCTFHMVYSSQRCPGPCSAIQRLLVGLAQHGSQGVSFEKFIVPCLPPQACLHFPSALSFLSARRPSTFLLPAHHQGLSSYLRTIVRSDWPPVSFSCWWHTDTLPALEFRWPACHPRHSQQLFSSAL